MKAWIKLIVYLVIVAGSMVVMPWIAKQASTYREIIQRSEELEIDNATLFYSEERWTSRAEQLLNSRLKKQHKP